MISTRVMDMKLREAAEGLGEDGTGKKKSKFKTFKKLFGKKKRKESPASTGNSTWKQNPAKSEVIALDSGPVGYDSEDELEESRGTMGNRALSHDSIFIPESGQDPARPVRVFSQENVCDRIKALQLKIQCNVKMGPPPPGGLPVKRAEDTGMSSEDDGLPRSPPEMSLLHDVGSGTTIKISLVSSSRPQSPDHTSDATGSAQTLDGSLAPVADFSHPPEFSSCLDNSAAKHKLLVKPRNQRSSRLRRLSSRAQSELLSDMGYTLEEEEYEEKPFFQVSMDETSRSGKQDLMLGRQPEPGRPVILLPLAGARARRSRLQHSPALSASMEVGSFLGEEFSSRPFTPEVPEPLAVPVPCLEPPALQKSSPYHSPHGEIQKEKLSTKGPCPLVEVTSHEVVCTSGDMETPSSTCTLPRDTAPLNENADVPKGDAAPSNEDTALPKGDLGLSNEDTALPKGDMAPSNEDSVLPKGDVAPSNEDAVLPKGDVAPSNEDAVLPKKEAAPSNEDSVLPKTEAAPSNEDSVLPKGDAVPSNEDSVLPKGDAVPSNEDAVLPKGDAVLPKGEVAPSNEDAVLPKGDVVPSKEDRVLLPKGDVIPSKEDRALAKGDVVPAKEATPSQGDKIPKENTTTEGDMVVFKGYTAPHKGDSSPSGTGTATAGKTTSDPHGRNQNVQTEEELTLVVPEPEGAGTVSPPGPARSSPVPKSCLKHKAPALEVVPGGSPGPAAKASPLREPSPAAPDREPTPPEHPKSAQAESPHAGPERAAPGRKSDRGGGAKKFSVSSSRARARAGSSRLLEHSGRVPAGGRMPLVRSGPAWRSEAALDDVQVPPGKADPPKPAEGEPRDSGASVASQAGLGRSPQDGAAEPGPGEPCAPVQEPSPGEDRSPFPVKLRSTSLSLKYREGPGQEAKGIKRYSAEVRMEKGGPALIPKAEQGHGGAVPALRGAKSPNGQGKGKARSPEQPSAKPPLPRKPLLQSLTLPYPPAGLDVSPGEPEKAPAPPEPRKESRVPEKALHRGTEKGLPPAETAPGADGKPTPPWITMTRQKRRGVPDLPPNQEDKPGSRILKTETGKQIKAPERPQESVKQADFVRSKSFLMTSVKPAMIQRQGSKLSLKEGLQRGISLSHQNLAQAAATTEKELHQLKRASYASADQPSWMELARKKSQAWSDMPQIIK